MSVDRKIPTPADHPSDIDGDDFANEIQEEIGGIWGYIAGIFNTVAGTNSITAVCPIPITAYTDGLRGTLTPANNNTGNVQINLDGVGLVDVLDPSGNPLPANYLVAGRRQPIEFDSGLNAFCCVGGTGSGSGIVSKVAVFANQPANGTAGGGATSGSWQIYPLAQTPINEMSGEGLTLTSNVITSLPAGTYDVFATVPFYLTGLSRLRLWNTTDSAVVTSLASDTVRLNDTNDIQSCTLRGRFTITAAKSFRLEYRVSSTRATDGLGQAASWTETEKYGAIMIARPAEGALNFGSIAAHNLTISTLSPSGGADGDIWMKVVP